MLTDFIQLVSEIFPSIDPKAATRCLSQLSHRSFDDSQLFCPGKLEYLAQGDVLAPVRFLTTDEDGGELEYTGPGILLSNTCDAEHEEHVIFAACYSYDLFRELAPVDEASLRSNCIFNLLYLPLLGSDGKGLVADLSLLQSHSRAFVTGSLLQGSVTKVSSLSQLGFYLLLAKVTIHLMRPEPAEVLRGPK